MKLLFLGDVVGRSGRQAICNEAKYLREKLNLDFLIVNVENATNGVGVTATHSEDIIASGVDCLTLGDHAFDQKDMISHIEKSDRIVRPLNFSHKSPGDGFKVFKTKSGKKILVVQLLGRVFMNRNFDDPFAAIDTLLLKFRLGHNIDIIIVDMHAEATSEKMALGHYLDGRVSLVVGTHTHVPTADCQILSKGTGYMTDLGMCGDYNSVIGMEIEEPISRFTTGVNRSRFMPAADTATLCGIFVEFDKLGATTMINPIKYGGKIGDEIV